MNYRTIAYVLGILLLVIGCSMILPILCSLYYKEDDLYPILFSAIISVALGLPFYWFFRKSQRLSIKDSYFIATFGWILVSAISALPFMIHGTIPSFADAFFEMMSGYSTSGATVLTDIEIVPHGLLFWRSQTHLLGGMGFLTLTVMFLPYGVGGLRLFRAESSPGQTITKEKLKPRNKEAMLWLWEIYLALNITETALLMLGGMSLFDSLCHSFGTVSTSGYSPKNASIGFYNSAYFDWVIIAFMFLGGTTFMLFYYIMKGNWKILKINTEFHWYVGFLLFFSGIVAWILWKDNVYSTFADSLRYGTFQVTSLLTTTGFTTADYEQWPQAAQMFLFAVCFIGASAGSTTSGIKVIHYVLIWKFMVIAVRQIFLQPSLVKAIRVNKQPVDSPIVNLAICYFIVNMFMVLAGGCFMVLVEDMDYISGMSSVIATLMNIGPGFGLVGPTENYAFISDVGKYFLTLNMLVGRLEMFSALVIFYPSFWRK
ncbi:MAG: TrkH family potassium uptake protein [Thermodesulfobacteriota bacterium]